MKFSFTDLIGRALAVVDLAPGTDHMQLPALLPGIYLVQMRTAGQPMQITRLVVR